MEKIPVEFHDDESQMILIRVARSHFSFWHAVGQANKLLLAGLGVLTGYCLWKTATMWLH